MYTKLDKTFSPLEKLYTFVTTLLYASVQICLKLYTTLQNCTELDETLHHFTRLFTSVHNFLQKTTPQYCA